MGYWRCCKKYNYIPLLNPFRKQPQPKFLCDECHSKRKLNKTFNK